MKNRAFAFAAIIAWLLAACAGNRQENAAPTPTARVPNAAVVMAKHTQPPAPAAVTKTPAQTIAPPAISFTAVQAVAGKTVYGQSCAACHGANLQGGGAPALAGSHAQLHTGGVFFATMATKMPLTAPGTLSQTQYLDIMAFLLKRNGYRASSIALTFAAAEHSQAPLPASP